MSKVVNKIPATYKCPQNSICMTLYRFSLICFYSNGKPKENSYTQNYLCNDFSIGYEKCLTLSQPVLILLYWSWFDVGLCGLGYTMLTWPRCLVKGQATQDYSYPKNACLLALAHCSHNFRSRFLSRHFTLECKHLWLARVYKELEI